MRRRHLVLLCVLPAILVVGIIVFPVHLFGFSYQGGATSSEKALDASVMTNSTDATGPKGDSPYAAAQLKSVADATRDGNHPERLTTMAPPTPFDANRYKADPASYLGVVEPGRVFQSLEPGEDVPALARISPDYRKIGSGESVELKVQAPGAPVSFTSFNSGQFENKLNTITVKADDSGVAKTQFYATRGTFNNVPILAACPVASGQVRFTVFVQSVQTSNSTLKPGS